MLVWFSGSDNTLLEPGRRLTSSLRSPKAILPKFLFLVQLQWVCAMIPCIKPSISLSLSFPFFLSTLRPSHFPRSVLFSPLLSPFPFSFTPTILATILQWAHTATVFAMQELVNRKNNCLPLWLWCSILRLGGLSWKRLYYYYHLLLFILLLPLP